MAHWLMKSEPESYGWADLVRDGGTEWDGVRNNAARLHLKAMKPGDEAFLYHSMSDKAVVGIMRVTRGAAPDPKDPDWVSVRVEPVRGAGAAGDSGRDQGRAALGEDGADPPVAAVGCAGSRRGMEGHRGNGRADRRAAARASAIRHRSAAAASRWPRATPRPPRSARRTGCRATTACRSS